MTASVAAKVTSHRPSRGRRRPLQPRVSGFTAAVQGARSGMTGADSSQRLSKAWAAEGERGSSPR
jgi:hypothetical protein